MQKDSKISYLFDKENNLKEELVNLTHSKLLFHYG